MKKTLRLILIFLVIVTIAWFLGTFFGKWAKTSSVSEALSLTFSMESLAKVVIPIEILAALAIAILLHIVLHEAGHLVFGLLTGYKFLSFSAFGLILIKEDDGLKIKRFSVPGVGGQCLMIPPDGDGDGSNVPVSLYNAGGVVFNLLLVLIALVLILLCHPASLFIRALLIGIIFVGVFLALVNGIPMHVGGMPNDGYNMLKLGSNPTSRQAFVTLLRLNVIGTRGVRPRDMSEQYFLPITEGNIDFAQPIQVNLLLMYITHLIDAGEMGKARHYLQQILDSQTKVSLFKLMAKCELASICMIKGEVTDCDKDLSKQDQATLKALEVSSSSIKRYRFLKALVEEKDLEKAESIYNDVRENKDKFLVKCEWEMDTEIMGNVLEKYKSGLHSTDA